MGDQIYKVRDPEGNIREIRGPEGASDDEVISQAKSLFTSTPGGAAVGNPALAKYGDKVLRPDSVQTDPLAAIGGAAATGGVLGAFGKEIMTGAGNVIGSFPYPAARTVGGALKAAGESLGAAGRIAPAVAGAISGGAGETAGQLVEAAGGGAVPAEAARIVAGGLTPETLTLGKQVLQKYILTPALSLGSKVKKEAAIALLEKIEGAPQSITQKELEFLNQQITELRGPGGKTDAPLESVGSIMGAEGQRLMKASELQTARALLEQGRVGGVGSMGGTTPELSDIGSTLRTTITKRHSDALEARSAEFKKTMAERDVAVQTREAHGQFVTQVPEYQQMIEGIKAQLGQGKRAGSVQAGLQRILDDIGDAPTFQALDDVRRKLGDAFRGKPSEGYDAIGEHAAKDLYAKVSQIQKKFAGPAQEKLLDDYAGSTAGLEVFSSKYGKKTTALDQYRDEQFATDAAQLPRTYFKTKAGVQALKDLTGDVAQVNAAAIAYTDKELAGKDAAGVRQWMSKNADWLSEVSPVRSLVEKYSTRLEAAERSMRNAQEFAAAAARDSQLLTRNALPAQRAVDLIKSGDTELWSKVAPVIAKSPQAKQQMVQAVRQVIADQATAKSTTDLFQRNIRPFLEKSGIASADEMNFIAQKLANIQEMKIPEQEKLGIARRIIMQSSAGWIASASGRGEANAYQWSRDKLVPE